MADREDRLPDSALPVLQRACASGYMVYISTARARAEVLDIDPDGMIGGNGSFAESRGRTLIRQTLSLSERRAVTDRLQSRGWRLISRVMELFASKDLGRQGGPAIKQYAV